MLPTSKVILPYEPDYVGHRQADERRKEVKEWLQRREREYSPSIVPDHAPERESTGTAHTTPRKR